MEDHEARLVAYPHSGQQLAEGEGPRPLDQAVDLEAPVAEVVGGQLQVDSASHASMVANLSHDFRTPLTSLRGYVEQLLEREEASPGERRRALGAILDNADRLTRLAQQLSTQARLDANDRPLQCEPFSLAELAHDIVGKFQHQARQSGIILEVIGEPSLPWVEADLGLIDRALSNLVENALHATPAGGRVRLELEAMAEGVRLAVADSGIGIAAEEVPLVTQRFYRTRGSPARGEGSGLGLSIVREICERHGTLLAIDSRQGEGTRISLLLPYVLE
ncbi:HAMP domain-containing sensor histidine kinase [Halomonas sp. 11-S5]|uniref:sensor histidine kinase n=1 Tax=Halomonas sp. 11-S5 TaxID=2994064 RepID=UPI00246868BD|nr:HAMP domain-containing sensor histidine kinase [Halomonas sp. 11-S5]